MKLRHLAKWNAQRRERAAEYDRLLAGNMHVTRPDEPSWSKAVYHLYVIRSSDREGMARHLKAAGIGTGIHYPIPLHFQKAYRSVGYKPGALPVAEAAATRILSLPMYPNLTTEQQNRVAEELLNMTAPQTRAGQLSLAVGQV